MWQDPNYPRKRSSALESFVTNYQKVSDIVTLHYIMLCIVCCFALFSPKVRFTNYKLTEKVSHQAVDSCPKFRLHVPCLHLHCFNPSKPHSGLLMINSRRLNH